MADWRDQIRPDGGPANAQEHAAMQREQAAQLAADPFGLQGQPHPGASPYMMPQGMVNFPPHLTPRDVFARTAMEEIPTATTMAAGALGGMTGPAAPIVEPLALGVGGAVGRAAALGLDQMFYPQEQRPEFWPAVGQEFLWNTGLGAGGRLAGAGLRKAGEEIYGLGLRAPKTMHQEFPGMKRFGAERGVIHLPQAVKGGTQTADDVAAALAKARQQGVYGRMSDIDQIAQERAQKALATGGATVSKKAQDRITKRAYQETYLTMKQAGMGETRLPPPVKVVGGKPRTMNAQAIRAIRMPPEEMHLLKQETQAAPSSQAAYRRVRLRGIPLSRRPEFQPAIAGGARRMLERVPGYDELMDAQKNYKGLQLALGGESAMHSPSFVQFGSGALGAHAAGLPAAMIAAEATAPVNLRRFGSLLTQPIPQGLIRYGPLAGYHGQHILHAMQDQPDFNAPLDWRDQFRPDSLAMPPMDWRDSLSTGGYR